MTCLVKTTQYIIKLIFFLHFYIFLAYKSSLVILFQTTRWQEGPREQHSKKNMLILVKNPPKICVSFGTTQFSLS